MNILETIGVPYYKKGSGIHIKEKNRGKFTASAKAAGKSVQEHAKDVLNDPNATPLQKKRANFARNSKKFKHQEGGPLRKNANTQNDSFSSDMVKKQQRDWGTLTYNLEVPYDPTKQFSGLPVDNGRKYDTTMLAHINNELKDVPEKQRSAILASMVVESDMNPFAHYKAGKTKGLLQWEGNRYDTTIKENPTQQEQLAEVYDQLDYLKSTWKNKSDKVSWTHGGEGSGLWGAKHAINTFWNENNSLKKVNNAFVRGYVRPKGKSKSTTHRLKIAKDIYNRITE